MIIKLKHHLFLLFTFSSFILIIDVPINTRADEGDLYPPAIILFIGDGMGETHRTAAQWVSVGQGGQLTMDQLPVHGWTRTASANNLVTDSAAASTAIATGQKTNNGVIGMDPDGNPLTNILEAAQVHDFAVGLVTDVQISHGTPAGFIAHVPSRYQMTEIALQMIDHHPNVLLGGGEDEFLPASEAGCYPESGERTDGRNLIQEAITAGYTYTCDAASFANVPITTTRLLGLFGDEAIAWPYVPTLVEMTDKALGILSQDPNGFFLMVEGGKIDWSAHDNDASEVISYTLELDAAVNVGIQYAATNPNATVIVAADHETGGMSVSLSSSGAHGEDGPFFMPDSTPFYVNWTTDDHTGIDVPLTAIGVLSDLFSGTYENTYIFDVMRQRVGWEIWIPFVYK